MEAERHGSEGLRVAALRSYGILDTPRESDFDEIVKVVSAICEAPISVINLIDSERQWFKAEVGLGVRETPLPASICAHAILQPDLFEVPDTLEDNRFSDNPLVTGDPRLRFYAGALLETENGLPLGTICVLDYKPRRLNENQKALLRLMSSQIMKMFELRRIGLEEHKGRQLAELKVAENATLIREVDHRVSNSLQVVSAVLSLQGRSNIAGPAREQIESAQRRVQAISTVHKQLYVTGNLEEVEMGGFLRVLCAALQENAPDTVASINVKATPGKMGSDVATSLALIMSELIANAFKHAFSEWQSGQIDVEFQQQADGWQLSVGDNGRGLPEGFDMAKSQGVGMKVINALVGRLNADVTFRSSSKGTVFTLKGTTRAPDAL